MEQKYQNENTTPYDDNNQSDVMNIPGGFPSAVQWYGNHFLDLLICIPDHNFYENICKDCYTPQMRQGFDEYSHRNEYIVKHQKAIPKYQYSDSPISGFMISTRKNIQSELSKYSGY